MFIKNESTVQQRRNGWGRIADSLLITDRELEMPNFTSDVYFSYVFKLNKIIFLVITCCIQKQSVQKVKHENIMQLYSGCRNIVFMYTHKNMNAKYDCWLLAELVHCWSTMMSSLFVSVCIQTRYAPRSHALTTAGGCLKHTNILSSSKRVPSSYHHCSNHRTTPLPLPSPY